MTMPNLLASMYRDRSVRRDGANGSAAAAELSGDAAADRSLQRHREINHHRTIHGSRLQPRRIAVGDIERHGPVRRSQIESGATPRIAVQHGSERTVRRLAAYVARDSAETDPSIHRAELEPGVHVLDVHAAVLRADVKIRLTRRPDVVAHGPALTASRRRSVGADAAPAHIDADAGGDVARVALLLGLRFDLREDVYLGAIPPVDAHAAVLLPVDVEQP